MCTTSSDVVASVGIPSDTDCGRDGGLVTPFAFSRAFKFAVKVASQCDVGHDYRSATELDIGFAFDVSTSGNLIACFLAVMLARTEHIKKKCVWLARARRRCECVGCCLLVATYRLDVLRFR